jgi:hypothetical protein
MPEFAGQVRHSNASFPVLDLTDGAGQFNQTGKSPVKGIGVFTNIASRSAVTSNYRTKGYLAVVGTTPYVYTSSSSTDSAWETEGNWAGLSSTNGIPSGGLEHNALVKLSDDDYDAGWTGDPEFSTLSLKKQDYPALNFLPNQTAATTDGTVLGRIQTKGISTFGGAVEVPGPKIDFVQKNSAGTTQVGGAIEFYTSGQTSGVEKAFTLNEEKTAIFAPNSSTPTPELGGFYYNSSENHFFVGVTE